MLPRLTATLRGLWWPIAFAAAIAAGSVRAERPPAQQLLPADTAVFISVSDAGDLSARFMNTSMGRMSQDPQMKPFVEHVYGSLADVVAGMQDRVGLSLPEMLAIPQGEVSLAVIAPEGETPVVVLLVDAGEHLGNVRTLLLKGAAAMEQQGAKKSEETVGTTKLTVYDAVGPRQRKVAFFEKDSTVVAGSSPEVLKQLLAAWGGQQKATLAESGKFTAIMRRCEGTRQTRPQVFWYVDPVAVMRSAALRNTQLQLAVAILPALGLDGLQGLGGSLTLDAGQFDSITQLHFLMESPRTGILEMIALDSGDTTPERWIPADVATYTTVHWNIEKSYRTLISLYDGFTGEGAFSREMDNRIKSPTGLDFEQDLLPMLSGRVTHFTWVERPVTPFSQATGLAFELKDSEAVAKVAERIVEKNKTVLARKSVAGKDYFQLAPPPTAAASPPGAPPTGEAPPPGAPPAGPRPVPCFGIVGKYLLFTDRPSLMEKVLAMAAEPGDGLAAQLDFKLVASRIRREAGTAKPAMIRFVRPEEAMRILYEVALADGTRELLHRRGERNPLLRSLDSALEARPLPPFAVLEQYLAPAGALMIDDETGIHFTSFSLRRTADAAPPGTEVRN